MLFYLAQRITCRICYVIGKLFLHLEIKGTENIKPLKHGGAIFISNHYSKWDSFLIGCSVPSGYFKIIKHLRYMAYPKYTDEMWYSWFIRLMGAYPIYRNGGDYKKTLKDTVAILKDGQGLVMYPTGRISHNFNAAHARPGIAYLARELNSLLVPVYVAGTHEIKLSEFLLRQRRAQVNFGKPFYVNEVTAANEDLRSAAKKIMERVGESALPAQAACRQAALKFTKPVF